MHAVTRSVSILLVALAGLTGGATSDLFRVSLPRWQEVKSSQ